MGECIYCGAVDGLSEPAYRPVRSWGKHHSSGRHLRSLCDDHFCFRTCAFSGLCTELVPPCISRRVGQGCGRHNHIVTLLRDGVATEAQVPADQEPDSYSYPCWNRHNSSRAKVAKTGILIRGVETLYFGVISEEFAKAQRASGLQQTDKLYVTSFARMIAKIGYCYICAMLGV